MEYSVYLSHPTILLPVGLLRDLCKLSSRQCYPQHLVPCNRDFRTFCSHVYRNTSTPLQAVHYCDMRLLLGACTTRQLNRPCAYGQYGSRVLLKLLLCVSLLLDTFTQCLQPCKLFLNWEVRTRLTLTKPDLACRVLDQQKNETPPWCTCQTT